MKNSIYVFATCDWFCTDGSHIVSTLEYITTSIRLSLSFLFSTVYLMCYLAMHYIKLEDTIFTSACKVTNAGYE